MGNRRYELTKNQVVELIKMKVAEARVKIKYNAQRKGNAIELEDLTADQLNAIVSNAFSSAARETMAIMGYNMIAEDGWVVKVYADGTKEKIKELEVVPRPDKIILY